MKFLCDRCNTRYSIGDDRVRGKILKVRCKNCANVVTVREGMPNTDRPPGAPRSPTTAAAVVGEAPARSALGAAFASAMQKPPPALEEEWYVSIDGEQSGPFTLADAQQWIAAKDHDADLHCWSEGFDDWLPVDKVSHFRNLRKRPKPPIPRLAGARAPQPPPPAPPEPEPEPKPTFAATMAALENTVHGLGAPVPSPSRTAAKLAPTSAPSRPLDVRLFPPAGRATPTNGRTNGAKTPAKPEPLADPADSATQIDASHFDVEPKDPFATVAEPFSSFERPPSDDPFARAADPPPPPSGGVPEDNDLDIGEVSRVVNLGDLARGGGRQTGSAASIGRQTGSVAARGRTEGGPPRTLGTAQLPPGALANGTSGASAILDPPVLAPMPAPPDAHRAHRRGMIALIAGAFVLVGIAVAVVFVFVVDSGGGGGGGGLGQVEEIDNTRPDVARPKRPDPSVATPADPTPAPGTQKVRRPGPSTQQPATPAAPTGNALQAQEIEEMAGKYSSVTQRCHMRAQRGTDGVLLADVKKIAVTLTINGDGIVTDAQLSDNHASNTLGKCLLSSIRSWKFRPSPGGTFKFVLLFG